MTGKKNPLVVVYVIENQHDKIRKYNMKFEVILYESHASAVSISFMCFLNQQ